MAELPQRRLAYELRIAIDRAVRSPQPRFIDKVVKLVQENPRGMKSQHVLHNLGVGRREALAQFVPTQNGRSLAAKEVEHEEA
jgi:hypothetical protein